MPDRHMRFNGIDARSGGYLLEPETVDNTLGAILKYQDDIQKIQGSEAAKILEEVKQEMAVAGR